MINSLLIFVYSYKNKDLQKVVDNIYETTDGDFSLVVVDQHPMDREYVFSKYKNLTYRHVYWDFLYSPIMFKQEYIENTDFEHYLIMADNILLKSGWNSRVMEMYHDDIVISGNSSIKIAQDDYFYLTPNKTVTDSSVLTNYVDRNFIFYSKNIMNTIGFSAYLKYNGEEEDMSIKLYRAGYDIYSATNEVYVVSQTSLMETLYVPYSLNHGYNSFLTLLRSGTVGDDRKLIKRSVEDFCNFHQIDVYKTNFLPFSHDDIVYDPNQLQIDIDHEAGSRRFLANLKGIF
jgi:hypothetical protein